MQEAQQQQGEVENLQIEDGVSYLEDDDPFRLEDAASTHARAKSIYGWVSPRLRYGTPGN